MKRRKCVHAQQLLPSFFSAGFFCCLNNNCFLMVYEINSLCVGIILTRKKEQIAHPIMRNMVICEKSKKDFFINKNIKNSYYVILWKYWNSLSYSLFVIKRRQKNFFWLDNFFTKIKKILFSLGFLTCAFIW